MNPQALPLAGIKVVEFSHMVMGPSCGLVLANFGADVIKVEPAFYSRIRNRLRDGSRHGCTGTPLSTIDDCF